MFKLEARPCASCRSRLPTLALAQGTAGISGQVKDATGGVLPGVTVEASSPALIEKTRVATTDGAGEFKIVSLPPGAYTVSFSLTGFSSVRREGIVLTTGFTATVDAELRVGAVEETITVSGDSPLVDVQNVKRQVVMTREMVDTLPTGKTAVEMATLIPGVQLMNGTGAGAAATGMGGSLGMDQFATLAAHGSRPADTRLEVNGVNINIFGQRQDSTYANFQDGNVQEYSFEISAHSAESETGGVRVTIVPKDGGNRYSGQFFANYADENFQSTNMTPELRATGLRDPDRTVSLWTVNPSLGGPIVRDRLWFYGGYSRMVNERLKAGTYFNTDLAAWRPTFDTSRQATALEKTHDTNIRLTWQAAAKHKVSFYYANNRLCQCPYLIGATYVGINAPEGATMAPQDDQSHAGELDGAAHQPRARRSERQLSALHEGPRRLRHAARAAHRRAVERRRVPRPEPVVVLRRREQDAGRERHAVLRHRHSRAQGRHHLSPRDGRTVLRGVPGPDLHHEQLPAGARAVSGDAVLSEGEREGVRPVRAGSVDARRSDDEPGPALRLLPAGLSGHSSPVDALGAARAQLPGGQAGGLEGPVAPHRRRLRPVRQRADRDQGAASAATTSRGCSSTTRIRRART